MTARSFHNFGALLNAAFKTPRAVETLGRALWLYLHFVRLANDRGMAIRTRARLAEDLAVSEETIERWIERLVKAELVRVLSPSPYLAISLRFWPGNAADEAQNAAPRSGKRAFQEKNPRGYSHSKAAAIAPSSYADGGAGEGDDLAVELRAVLPEAGETEITRILNRYPRAVLRRALERVAKTPRIRTSKAALFRYLLAKFSEEIDVQDL
jgi:hypothetical protein